MTNRLKAGTAATVITPALGTAMAGSFRPVYAEDVHDELFARALVLQCGSVRLALVTCDLIAASGSMVEAVKARVEERCGIPPAFVMVNATHTHTGLR